jgi:hypothetical protein
VLFSIRRHGPIFLAACAVAALISAQPAYAYSANTDSTGNSPTETVTPRAGETKQNCSVSRPRVRYWCDTVRPLTAYTDGSTVRKHYNEMYEGGSLPIGIYMQSGSTKFHVVNGTGYVYKTVQSTTAKALCWNRSRTRTSSAHCDYVRG